MSAPAGVDAAVYERALADVRALRPYGTYRHDEAPDRLPPTERPECGSRSGYRLHRRAGEDACEPCKGANAAATWLLASTGTSREQGDHTPRKDSAS